MLYVGYFCLHYLCWFELNSSFNSLDYNYSSLNLCKYINDMTNIVYVHKLQRDEHNIYIEIVVDRKKILPEDINTIGRMIVSFLTVPLKKFNGRDNKKIDRYETDGIHMFFIKTTKPLRKLV